tara:strand:+ start:28764 stop:29444 length:681 start_codon:yes stop_codon:yes gene_type:complete
MHQLKGKKKRIIILILLFFFLTTYNYNNNIIFPFFKIEQIEFRGDNLIEENIKNQIVKELQNKSLFFLKKNNFKNILSNSNWIESFKIKKSYPNKITIILNELSPVAFYSNQGNNYLINSEYINSKKIYNKENIGLFKVSGNYNSIKLKNIYLNLKLFPNLKKKIYEIKYLKSERWDMFTKKTKIQLGRYDFEKQFKYIEIILKQNNNIKILDMRVQNRMVITHYE